MTHTLMVLPATDKSQIRLMKVPPDYESQELYRHVTGLIAKLEQQEPGCSSDDVIAMLEEHGFEAVNFELGPSLD
ncbi:MAG: hypothetical protein KDJ24_05230 [Gammaproteobacteria bacterium]|nr:hypothetical protein [Gammaproteobacteria bacterium]